MGALTNFASKVEDVQAEASEWSKDLIDPYRAEKGYTYSYKPTTRDRIVTLLMFSVLRLANKEFRIRIEKSLGDGFDANFRTKTNQGPSFDFSQMKSPIQP